MSSHETCKSLHLSLNAAAIELSYALQDPDADRLRVVMTASQGIQQLVSQLNEFVEANPFQSDQQELDLTAAQPAE